MIDFNSIKNAIVKNINRNNILIAVAVIGIAVTGGLIYLNSNPGFSFPVIFGMSDSQIAQKAIDYINSNNLASSPASLVSAVAESGLVKVKIKIGDTEFDSYATRDGKLLFPQAFDMIGKASTDAAGQSPSPAQTAEEIIASIQKSDKPTLEAFVVARCPFGLQMQRMIADAVKNIPSLAQYVKVEYFGSVSGNTITSMHGDAEAQENLRQICIREEQPAKYWNYVSCQMKTGDTAGCQTSTGINSTALTACVSTPSRGVAYAQKDFDLATKYGVTGSPTLVVNGLTVPEYTSDNQPVFGSARSSDEIKTIVCDASNTQSAFCSTKLNTAQAATSFSQTYAADSAAASGNSGATGANCAPAQ
jgi:hypothetical protein